MKTTFYSKKVLLCLMSFTFYFMLNAQLDVGNALNLHLCNSHPMSVSFGRMFQSPRYPISKKIEWKGKCNDGLKDGLWIAKIDDKIIYKINYSNGELHGKFEKYFLNDNGIEEEGHFHYGFPHGKYVKYEALNSHGSLNKKSISIYVNYDMGNADTVYFFDYYGELKELKGMRIQIKHQKYSSLPWLSFPVMDATNNSGIRGGLELEFDLFAAQSVLKNITNNKKVDFPKTGLLSRGIRGKKGRKYGTFQEYDIDGSIKSEEIYLDIRFAFFNHKASELLKDFKSRISNIQSESYPNGKKDKIVEYQDGIIKSMSNFNERDMITRFTNCTFIRKPKDIDLFNYFMLQLHSGDVEEQIDILRRYFSYVKSEDNIPDELLFDFGELEIEIIHAGYRRVLNLTSDKLVVSNFSISQSNDNFLQEIIRDVSKQFKNTEALESLQKKHRKARKTIKQLSGELSEQGVNEKDILHYSEMLNLNFFENKTIDKKAISKIVNDDSGLENEIKEDLENVLLSDSIIIIVKFDERNKVEWLKKLPIHGKQLDKYSNLLNKKTYGISTDYESLLFRLTGVDKKIYESHLKLESEKLKLDKLDKEISSLKKDAAKLEQKLTKSAPLVNVWEINSDGNNKIYVFNELGDSIIEIPFIFHIPIEVVLENKLLKLFWLQSHSERVMGLGKLNYIYPHGTIKFKRNGNNLEGNFYFGLPEMTESHMQNIISNYALIDFSSFLTSTDFINWFVTHLSNPDLKTITLNMNNWIENNRW